MTDSCVPARHEHRARVVPIQVHSVGRREPVVDDFPAISGRVGGCAIVIGGAKRSSKPRLQFREVRRVRRRSSRARSRYWSARPASATRTRAQGTSVSPFDQRRTVRRAATAASNSRQTSGHTEEPWSSISRTRSPTACAGDRRGGSPGQRLAARRRCTASGSNPRLTELT